MNKIKNNLLLCVAAVCAIVALFMIFAPASRFNEYYSQSFTGAQMTFGYAKESAVGSGKNVYFNFSANILTYLFLICGIVFAVLAGLGKLDKISRIVSAGSFILAGIFYFLMVRLSSFGEGLNMMLLLAEITDVKLVLGAGAIAGGIFALIAAFLVILDIFKGKILKKG